MNTATPNTAGLEALVGRLVRYGIGAVYAPPRTDVSEALRTILPDVQTVDVLDGLAPSTLDALLARDAAALAEAPRLLGPALIVGIEAVWSTLAPDKLEDAWRRIALSEPPSPRLLLLRSPHFLDRLDRAFGASPRSSRLFRWIPS